jgi:hypothetical protein
MIGDRHDGRAARTHLSGLVRSSEGLRMPGIWNEVKDNIIVLFSDNIASLMDCRCHLKLNNKFYSSIRFLNQDRDQSLLDEARVPRAQRQALREDWNT